MLSACLSMFSPSSPSASSPPAPVSLLVLGAGWTFGFLEPLLREAHPGLAFAATTRDGRDGSIKWAFDPEAEGEGQFAALPRAETVVVTFPIRGVGGSRTLVEGYEKAHGEVKWIQLGSTGIWDVSRIQIRQVAVITRHLSAADD